MSVHIQDGNKNVSFIQFCLSESIRPRQTEFGINISADDGRYMTRSEENEVSTLFKISDDRFGMVSVQLDSGEILFETSSKFSLNPADFSMDRYQVKNSATIFSKVIFIALTIILAHDLESFMFAGHDRSLGIIYDKLSQNKFFLSDIEELGYSYAGKNADGYHVYRKNIE